MEILANGNGISAESVYEDSKIFELGQRIDALSGRLFKVERNVSDRAAEVLVDSIAIHQQLGSLERRVEDLECEDLENRLEYQIDDSDPVHQLSLPHFMEDDRVPFEDEDSFDRGDDRAAKLEQRETELAAKIFVVQAGLTECREAIAQINAKIDRRIQTSQDAALSVIQAHDRARRNSERKFIQSLFGASALASILLFIGAGLSAPQNRDQYIQTAIASGFVAVVTRSLIQDADNGNS